MKILGFFTNFNYKDINTAVSLLDGGEEAQMQVVEENEDVGDDSEKETTRAVAGMQAVSNTINAIASNMLTWCSSFELFNLHKHIFNQTFVIVKHSIIF